MYAAKFSWQVSRVAIAIASILAVAGCAGTGRADRGAKDETPVVANASVVAAAPVEAAAAPSAVIPGSKDTSLSALVRPGQDPAIAGPGADMRASPPGFLPMPAGLRERVELRWKLLIAGSGEKAYDFLSAGVRSSLNRDTYAGDMRSRPVKWVKAEALDAKCESTTCAARVLMSFSFAMQSTGVREMETQSPVTERWIKVGDEWFHIPEQYLEGFAK